MRQAGNLYLREDVILGRIYAQLDSITVASRHLLSRPVRAVASRFVAAPVSRGRQRQAAGSVHLDRDVPDFDCGGYVLCFVRFRRHGACAGRVYCRCRAIHLGCCRHREGWQHCNGKRSCHRQNPHARYVRH
jgi:hypothetical protein